MRQLLEKDFFRIDEVAAYCSVSTRTVRRWIDNGLLQSRKLGGVVRIPRPMLVEFISTKAPADIGGESPAHQHGAG